MEKNCSVLSNRFHILPLISILFMWLCTWPVVSDDCVPHLTEHSLWLSLQHLNISLWGPAMLMGHFMSCLASANIKHRLHCQEQYLCNAKIFISILLQMGFNCWNVLGDWVSLSSFHKSVTTVTGEKRRFQQDRHFTGWSLCWLDTFYIIFCSPHRHRKGRQGRGGWPRLKLINVFKNVWKLW